MEDTEFSVAFILVTVNFCGQIKQCLRGKINLDAYSFTKRSFERDFWQISDTYLPNQRAVINELDLV